MAPQPRTFLLSQPVDPTLGTIQDSVVGAAGGTSSDKSSRGAEADPKPKVPKGRLTYKERKKQGLPSSLSWLREEEPAFDNSFHEKTSAMRRVVRKKRIKASRNPSGQQHKDRSHTPSSPGSNIKSLFTKRAAALSSSFFRELAKLSGLEDPNNFIAEESFVGNHIRNGRPDDTIKPKDSLKKRKK